MWVQCFRCFFCMMDTSERSTLKKRCQWVHWRRQCGFCMAAAGVCRSSQATWDGCNWKYERHTHKTRCEDDEHDSKCFPASWRLTEYLRGRARACVCVFGEDFLCCWQETMVSRTREDGCVCIANDLRERWATLKRFIRAAMRVYRCQVAAMERTWGAGRGCKTNYKKKERFWALDKIC